ncbi:MAG: tail fiber domain-containing protein [Bacteroidales bacterium]|nr:tail fiber domain-containing protein [Bacteroidales bacterium]
MKTKKIWVIFFLVVFFYQANAQVKVNSNGNVGIGNTGNPTDKLWVEGVTRFSAWADLIIDWSGYGATVYPEYDNCGFLGKNDNYFNHLYVTTVDYKGGLYHVSDKKYKENISKIENMLKEIEKINVYTYYFNDEYYKGYTEEQKMKSQKMEYGFIAQEIQDIFPNFVDMSSDSILRMDYVRMIPILTQGIKDLQKYAGAMDTVIVSQEKELIELRQIVNELQEIVFQCCETTKSKKSSIEPESPHSSQERAILYQNTPNPFSSNTEISCYVPETTGQAFIYIYNLQGVELKAYPVSQAGRNAITVRASDLTAGMYLYTLVVDGEIIDTKRMILTN